MAFTLTRVQDGTDVYGRNKVAIFDVAITGSYTVGGYSIAAGDVGLKAIKGIDIVGGDVSQLTYFPFFDFGAAGQGLAWPSAKLRLATASGTEATSTLVPAVNLRIQVQGL